MSKIYFWYEQKRRKRNFHAPLPFYHCFAEKESQDKNLSRPTQHPALHCSSCSHSITPWVFSIADLKYLPPQHLKSYTPGWGFGKIKKEPFALLNYFWMCRKVCTVSRTHSQCLFKLLLPSVKTNTEKKWISVEVNFFFLVRIRFLIFW